MQNQLGSTHKINEAALPNEIEVGSVVKLLNLRKQSPREASYGVVRWMGPTRMHENTVGVQLENDDGDTNGYFEGVQHFRCVRGEGKFVKLADCLPDDRTQQLQEKTTEIDNLTSKLNEQNHQLQENTTERNSLISRLQYSQGQLNERTQQLQEKTTEIDNLISHSSLPRQQLDESRNNWLIDRAELELSEETIGRGAWGSVTKAKFRGTKVAVKKIHDLIVSPHTQGLFVREMSIASRCRHPYLVQFIGATSDRTPLFVMELMQTDLRSQLGREALSEENYLHIGHDVSQALAYLHLSKPKPILHRDISSANVLLYKAGGLWRGKLSDYGSANFMRQATTNNPGAVSYSAPESGGTTQTTKLDVYSFGVLFCEMIIRKLPIPEERNEQLFRIQNSDYRGFVARCVSSDIDRRPSTLRIVEQFEGWKTPFL